MSDSRHIPRSAPPVELLLAALRADYPDWGIVYDAFAEVWIALRGKNQALVGADAGDLRSRLARAEKGASWM